MEIDKALQALLVGNTTLPQMLGLKKDLGPSMQNLPMSMEPGRNAGLESWQAGEEGGGVTGKRPAGIPLESEGVSIHKNVRPMDVLGDVTSHMMTNPESAYYKPALDALYRRFTASLDPGMQRERYQYSKKHFGENRPFEQWAELSGYPSMMRGYVFDQWPKEEFGRLYTPEQMQMLDGIKQMLGIKQVNGIDLREHLHPSEDAFFKQNPKVAGMAAEDDKIIMNPYSKLSDSEKQAVMLNEAARVYMRKGEPPRFALTPEQEKSFSGYSSNPTDRASTVAARILSGDPSALQPTPEQLEYVQQLKKRMGIK